VAACADRCRVLVGGAIHCTTHRRQVRNLVSLVHGCAGCFTVQNTWLIHAIWARQEPHVVHQRTIRPYPKQQKVHSRCTQYRCIELSTTLAQDTGKTGGTMTGSTLRGGGVTPRRYHTNSRCGPTTMSPEKLLRSSGAHIMLRARIVPACAARAYLDSDSRPQVLHSGHRGGGRGGAADATRTAAVDPQRGVQRSYCAAAGPTPCYVPAWYPLARRACTQTAAADARCPTAAQRGRSRRHTNSRCGPTTKNPEKLLRRSRTSTMLHACKVPLRAGTSNAA
jgi:hypothetical protein